MTAFHALVIYRDSLPHGSIYSSVITALLAHAEQIRTMTIEQAAEICFTSPATLSRLTRQLGYLGYADFRSSLDHACRNYFFENRVMPRIPDQTFHPGDEYLSRLGQVIEQFRHTTDLELFHDAACAMHEATSINLFVGEIPDFAMVQLQVDLTVAGKACRRYPSTSDQYARAETLDENAFVILLYGGASLPSGKHTFSEVLSKLRERHVKLMLLAPRNAPLKRFPDDFLFSYDSTGTAMDNYLHEVILSMLTLTYRTLYLENRSE